MMVVKDAMVLIHLAKFTLLKTSCEYFSDTVIPPLVYEETVTTGRDKDYPDAEVIAESIESGEITVIDVTKDNLIDRANQYNLYGGEAEAVALYWETDADLMASDDDNVRRKRTILDLTLIGTPSILIELFDADFIDSRKLRGVLDQLREIGWFSTGLLDKIEIETGIA